MSSLRCFLHREHAPRHLQHASNDASAHAAVVQHAQVSGPLLIGAESDPAGVVTRLRRSTFIHKELTGAAPWATNHGAAGAGGGRGEREVKRRPRNLARIGRADKEN